MRIVSDGYDLVPIDSLEDHPDNARVHDDELLDESIDANGFFGAVYVQRSTRRILAGHGARDAARRAGGEVVPVVWLDVDDGAAARILAVANRANDRAGYREDRLATLLEGLRSKDNLRGTGYDPGQVERLLTSLRRKEAAASADDEVPEVEETEPLTRPADLWRLGRHRLLCGDATSAESYERLLEGERAALCLTDPPYGVGIDYGSGVVDDEAAISALIGAFVPLVLSHAERVFITSGQTLAWLYPRPSWVLGSGVGPWGFECLHLVLAYGMDPYLSAGLGARPDTFVGSGEGPSSAEHPVAKPLAVWTWLIERGSLRTDDLVLDPFAGSGTTLVAAEKLHRRSASIELSPLYCDVACRRFQRLTGTRPILERTGEAVDFS